MFALLPVCVLTWVFAIQKTFDEIRLHSDLEQKIRHSGDLAQNPDYLMARSKRLRQAVNRYRVDSLDWHNEFWIRMSSLTAGKRIDLIYMREKDNTVDSTRVRSQGISFRGNFRDLVLLIDTAEKINHIGRISHIRMYFSKSKAEAPDKITMDLKFLAILKE